MKKIKKYLLLLIIGIALPCCFLFTGCSSNEAYIISIQKSATNGLQDTYTITYSDGKTSDFVIKNGADGKDLTALEIYEEYNNQYPDEDISYKDFVKQYLSSNGDNALIVNQCLQSCLKVYSEFKVTSYVGFPGYQQVVKSVAVSSGSAVVYKIENDYTYIITNYHVIYNINSNTDNGGKYASKIVGYLYGSESGPVQDGKDANDYTVYNYGDYGITLEYVGGSASSDIAILKTQTSNILAVNENTKAVVLAEDYHVGETAIAIGNPEDEGISVTEGIISVTNELVSLSVDGTVREHRSLRIDTPLYSGNSGGGLFNCYGELIGITNAGDNADQNVNFAVPLEIVRNVANNILYYANDNNEATNDVYYIKLGISIKSTNSKYVYNTATGYGEIIENVIITEVTENSIASTLGIQNDYQILSIIINDEKYIINQSFDITEYLINIRLNNTIQLEYKSGNTISLTEDYQILTTDLVKMDESVETQS